jgi:hypothetical protein
MPTKNRQRSKTLAAGELGRLHEAVAQAESVLLFSALPDARLGPLRDEACELSCSLLSTLAQLREGLKGRAA